MFICQNCHPQTTCSLCGGPDNHFDFKDSYGRCEVCTQTTGCTECFHHHTCPVIAEMVKRPS